MPLWRALSSAALLAGGVAPEFGVVNTEDFSADFGSWTTPGSQIPDNAWSRISVASPTTTGGPDGGSNTTTRIPTSGNGYAYVEADDAGTNFSLESPALDASLGTFTIEFDYHARFGSAGGIADGTLEVQGFNGTVWSAIGPQIVGSQQLTSATPYLPSTTFGTYNSAGFSNIDFRFRFRFTRGASPFTANYDAAVDNIVINGPGDPIIPPVPSIFPSPLYGGQFAPWAIPASEIPTHPNSQNLLNEVFAICPGRINMNFDKFTPVIYDNTVTNVTATLNKTSSSFGGSLGNGAQIPWQEPQFLTPGDVDPSDSDSYTVLVNSQTGLCFEFFQSLYNPSTNVLSAGRGSRIKTDIDETGPDANLFTKQNGNRDSRACGLQHVVGVVLRSEFEAGFIPHCMTFAYINPTQFAFEAPATKGAGGTGGPANRGFMGLRIVWDGLTQTDIDNWVATKPAATRPFLRVVAECARDFGFMVTDHAGNAALRRGATQIEHELSAKWSEIGVTQDNSILALHSLLEPNQSKARALALPTFVGGSSQNVACYAGVPYPQGHPCNP